MKYIKFLIVLGMVAGFNLQDLIAMDANQESYEMPDFGYEMPEFDSPEDNDLAILAKRICGALSSENVELFEQESYSIFMNVHPDAKEIAPEFLDILTTALKHETSAAIDMLLQNEDWCSALHNNSAKIDELLFNLVDIASDENINLILKHRINQTSPQNLFKILHKIASRTGTPLSPVEKMQLRINFYAATETEYLAR